MSSQLSFSKTKCECDQVDLTHTFAYAKISQQITELPLVSPQSKPKIVGSVMWKLLTKVMKPVIHEVNMSQQYKMSV